MTKFTNDELKAVISQAAIGLLEELETAPNDDPASPSYAPYGSIRHKERVWILLKGLESRVTEWMEHTDPEAT